MKKLRIGILFPDIKKLENWEFRLFYEIVKSDWAEIVILIKDQRKREKGNYINKLLNSKNIINKGLLKCINFIELKLIKQHHFSESKKIEVLEKLNRIEEVFLKPNEKGKYTDYFDASICQKIKDLKLDVLLRHEFRIIKGEILNIPKHGIWSFHHGDNDINRGGPPGFWEIVFNQPVTGVTLQILTEELDGGKVVEKGFYSTKKSFLLNQKYIYEKSVEIILKNLKLLHLNGFINSTPSKPYTKKILNIPTNIFWIFKYCYLCFGTILNRIKIFLIKSCGYKFNVWSIFFKKGKIISSNLINSEFIKPGRDEFWADPFVISVNKKNYVFFENYSYKSKKGKISCGILSDGKIENISDALEFDYHLSYPFIFKMDNAIYMMPETVEAKRLEIYKAIDFPTKWKLYSTEFKGEGIADPTLFIDKKKNIWLFLNKSKDPYNDYNSELYIYKITDLNLTTVISHKLNPVIIDSRRARNAGNIFLEGDKVIRPSQKNINSIYGYGLNLSEITDLSIKSYSEKLIKTFEPDFKKGLVGVHHVTQFDNGFLFDSCYKKNF